MNWKKVFGIILLLPACLGLLFLFGGLLWLMFTTDMVVGAIFLTVLFCAGTAVAGLRLLISDL